MTVGEGLLVEFLAEPRQSAPQLRGCGPGSEIGGPRVELRPGARRQGGRDRAHGLARLPAQPRLGERRAGGRQILDQEPRVLELAAGDPLGHSEGDRELGTDRSLGELARSMRRRPSGE
nr:hypothetical protein [Rathayibacter tritici]